MRPRLAVVVAVGLGSGLGAVARYLCSAATLAALGPAFPWGTLAVNVVGSFLIGLYATLTGPQGRLAVRPATRHFVLTGFCGGFTTFSIFSLETVHLVERGAPALAAANVAVSTALWLVAVWLGYRLAVRLSPPARPVGLASDDH
jgi:fluoride exporter